jgi:hypothetical protein
VTIAHYKNQPQKNIHVSWQTWTDETYEKNNAYRRSPA